MSTVSVSALPTGLAKQGELKEIRFQMCGKEGSRLRKFCLATKRVCVAKHLHKDFLRDVISRRVAKHHTISDVAHFAQVTLQKLVEIGRRFRCSVSGEQLFVSGFVGLFVGGAQSNRSPTGALYSCCLYGFDAQAVETLGKFRRIGEKASRE